MIVRPGRMRTWVPLSSWSPLQLSPVAWYDPSNLGSLWKDTAGTSAVTADGDAVARIDDLSGNGNHMTQSTASQRPIYRVSGSLKYLEYDNTDDALVCSSLTGSRASATIYCVTKLFDVSSVFWCNSTLNFVGVAQSGSATTSMSGDTYSGQRLNAVEFTGTRGDLYTAAAANPIVYGVNGLNMSSWTTLGAMGGAFAAPWEASAFWYGGILLSATPSAANQALLETYLGNKAGLSL